MFPQSHFLFAFFISEILVKLGFISHTIAISIAILATLIDIDHLICFALKRHEISLKHAWNECVRGRMYERTFIHHKIGFILITALIVITYFINPTITLILSIAYYSHIFLDYAHLNILRIRGKVTDNIEGYAIKINKFEILFDVILLVGIILLIT